MVDIQTVDGVLSRNVQNMFFFALKVYVSLRSAFISSGLKKRCGEIYNLFR